MNVTLFVNRFYEDLQGKMRSFGVVRSYWMRSYWTLIRYDLCPYKKIKSRHRDSHIQWKDDVKTQGGSTSTSQGMPETTRS